ncbi:helix-turn-helix domain-containing protein [Sphingobacterium sp. HJSM2_6]|uniref:helix-turn-helix domain-containing protein n=1 Tax=Sphingobacterium sp. HJSM2_6 TaxID=3366264 RepID=UPI003BCF28F5
MKKIKNSVKLFNILPFLLAVLFYLYVLYSKSNQSTYLHFYYICSTLTNLIYPAFILLFVIKLLRNANSTIVILLELICFLFIGKSFFLLLDYLDYLNVINLDFNPIVVISVLIIISIVILGWFIIHKEKIDRNFAAPKNLKINEGDMDYCKEKIAVAMDSSQLYLDNNLNMFKLSQHLNISEHLLRHYIYEYLGTTFNDWIAEFRIQHAILLMKESQTNWKLDFIASVSGFKSRTTFNRYFKELFGITASDFRNKLS